MKHCIILLSCLLPFLASAQQSIGINTDNPQFDLDIRSTDFDLGSFLQLGNASADNFLRIFSGRQNDPSPFLLFNENDTFRIATSQQDFSNFNQLFRIDPSGFVRIGGGMPLNKLHIHDDSTFMLPPPFSGFYGKPTYLQITNGVSPVGPGAGLRVGVSQYSGGEILSSGDLKLQSEGASMHMFSNVVQLDSNLWISGNISIPSIANGGNRNIIIDSDGFLQSADLITADTDWEEDALSVYHISKKVGVGLNPTDSKFTVLGPKSTGTVGAMKIISVAGVPPSEQIHHMVLDGNSLDVNGYGLTDGELHIQSSSEGNINMVRGGGTVAVGALAASNRKLMVQGEEIQVGQGGQGGQNLLGSPATFSIFNFTNFPNEMIFDGDDIQTLDNTLQINTKSERDISMGGFTGRVGIGTLTPQQRLHMHTGGGNYLYLTSPSTGSNPVTDGARIGLDSADDLLIFNAETKGLNFGTNNKVRMRINEDGRIAIGPVGAMANGYLLSVQGQIIAEEVLVQLQGDWPDYVFSEKYPLLSLDQFAGAIRENGHMPGIPTAAKIEESGLQLGEMQRKMMEKIEELSLYVIQLHERIKTLEGENEILKSNN